MKIPGAFLRHTVEVEAYKGEGAKGPTWDRPRRVRCWIPILDTGARLEADARTDGEAETIIRTRLEVAVLFEPGSRVRLPNGRLTTVVDLKRADDRGMGAMQHLQVVVE